MCEAGPGRSGRSDRAVSIRAKVIACLALLFVVLGLAEVAVQQRVLMPSFAELERNDAHTAMRRVGYALDASLDRLEINAGDWGNWSDTYRFVHNHDPEYALSNFTPIALRQLKYDWYKGPQFYRKCDHQSVQSVVIVESKSKNMKDKNDVFNVLAIEAADEKNLRTCDEMGHKVTT